MKKLIALLFTLIFMFGIAYSESPATPTDLVEIEEDDCGYIEIHLDRKVFLDFIKLQPFTIGDEIGLVAILMDFLPDDKYTFVWEYSIDGIEWQEISGETEQLYYFILDKDNANYYWRVIVTIQEE